MLDALSFALFGKAHRSVSKGQLVNSVNNKNCVVEVEFTALGSEYKVVRGIKPTKFEIWRDDKVINQDSHSKEYQKVLEQNILKLNHKSFHQIIVLGSSSFVPFMQLPANHRREVIEDLLDINVFSKMNVVLKEKFSVIKEKVRANQSDLENLEYKIKTQTKYVESLEKNKRDNRNEKLNEMTTLASEIEGIRSIMTPVDDDSLHVLKTEHDSCNSLMIQIKQYDKTFNSKLKELDKEKQFYEDNSSCPTCEQGIETNFKEKKISEAETKYEHFTDARSKASDELGKLTARMVGVVSETRKLQDMIAEQDRKQVEISQLQKQITTIQQYLAKQDETTTDIAEERKTLSAQNDDREILRDIKGDLAESVAYSMVITELLKDTGIKTKIVKEYLPVINQLVNKYLQVLDFFVSFNLDEQFKETIRSRHRDAFSYDSFSEGEKQRIDLALLFTWRQIAKMKNSVATNLLILDETFDSSLDVEGIDNLTSILDTLDGDTNTYVISHKGELLDGKFEDKIEFIKKGNFSTVHDA
jgi:DNA repair exonuclease SbcCD ATPase subunit